jgi:hypothetical protein
MITYRDLGLRGRLGNALFQFASTMGIAWSLNQPARFPDTWIHRPYFDIPDGMFGNVPPDATESYELVSGFDPRALLYLQDYRLFAPYMENLRWWLEPSQLAKETLLPVTLPRPILGVHVRRGDNVSDAGVPNKSDYHICPPLNYYQRGIAQFEGQYNSVVICSDDQRWCADNLKADLYGHGIAHPKEHEPDFLATTPVDWMDLFLLAECDYFVLSGSTFGTWGALLANVPPDHVIRPDQTFGPQVAAYTDFNLMFDPGWRVQSVA